MRQYDIIQRGTTDFAVIALDHYSEEMPNTVRYVVEHALSEGNDPFIVVLTHSPQDTPPIAPWKCAFYNDGTTSARMMDISGVAYDAVLLARTSTIEPNEKLFEWGNAAAASCFARHRPNGVTNFDFSLAYRTYIAPEVDEKYEFQFRSGDVTRARQNVRRLELDIRQLQESLGVRKDECRQAKDELVRLTSTDFVISVSPKALTDASGMFERVIPMADGLWAFSRPITATDDSRRELKEGDAYDKSLYPPIPVFPHAVHLPQPDTKSDGSAAASFMLHPQGWPSDVIKGHPHLISNELRVLSTAGRKQGYSITPCIGGEMVNALAEARENQDVQHMLDLMAVHLTHYTSTDSAGESFCYWRNKAEDITRAIQQQEVTHHD